MHGKITKANPRENKILNDKIGKRITQKDSK